MLLFRSVGSVLITLAPSFERELKRAKEEKEAKKKEASDYGNKRREEGSEGRCSDY